MRKIFYSTAVTLLVCKMIVGQVTAPVTSVKKLEDYVWDLSYIFSSDKAWDEELRNVQTKIKTIGSVKSTMGKSAKELAKAMDAIYDLRSRAAKLEIYGALRSDVNIKDEAAARMASVGTSMEREVESAISFLAFEINKIGNSKLLQWIKTEPGLERHKRRINRILLEAPYTNSPEVESVLESMKGWPAVSGDGFFAMYESDLNWPTYKNAEGKDIKIPYTSYRSARRSANQQERVDIAKAFLNFAGFYKNIFGFLYTKRIEADLVIAKKKKFDDAIDAIWYLRDGVPVGSYKTMLNVAAKNNDVLNKCAGILSKLLGVEKISYQDFYALPKSYSRTFPVDEAFEIILDALKPMGKEFIDKAKEEITKPTMHLVPLPEKRAFYSNQLPIAGMPSYTMLTYGGTFSALGALMGAIAQKVRYANIPKENCPDTRDDPPTYTNVMLYVTEMLLSDYMIEKAKTKEEKLFYLHQALFRLWTHNFGHVINAELDAVIQQMVINNNPPGGEKISETYYQLLRKWYGNIGVDSVFANEWMANSVPFQSYEGQFWISAMASACLAYENIKKGKPNANKVVTEYPISKTETDLSYHILKSLDIDLVKEEPYQAMYDRMNYLIDEIEKLLK